MGERVRAALGDGATRAFVVVDANVPGEHVNTLTGSLDRAGFGAQTTSFDPTEKVKTIATAQRVLESLAATGQDRGDPVVALGGGIVGDVAGFVAATYRRGVPVVQCPTTVLAMVDASVGGKTGVNLEVPGEGGERLLKNMVGSFHQPVAVVADVDVLASLPDRHVRSGLAECVKHAMIAQTISGEDLMSWLETNADRVLGRDPGAMTELVRKSVAIKADAVASDERETAPSSVGGRALLNLGHTFGHAIETLPGISPDPADPSRAPLHHGEAVALGLVAACACSARLGMIDAAWSDRVRALLGRLGLPVAVAGLPGNGELLARMGHDKKVRAGVLRLVLPEGDGRAQVVEDPDPSAVEAGLDAIRA
ncbi:MAG: 3-dehydroquinate synthase [Phycisphaeraceae bacterium]|nr:MAG: 3-dehydroquinate synthase [Phycisphaeraceae bacterium]